jgi:hypothetical protein
MTRVSFHELAERELNDAALYYEQKKAGLGIKFIEALFRPRGLVHNDISRAVSMVNREKLANHLGRKTKMFHGCMSST